MKHHLEHFHEMKTLTRKGKFLILSLFPLYFIVIGLVVQPFPDILKGLIRIVIEPDLLITDYFAVGGIGAAMINAGIITCIMLITKVRHSFHPPFPQPCGQLPVAESHAGLTVTVISAAITGVAGR